MVQINYGVGWTYDGERTSGGIEGTWTETEDGNVGTFTVDEGDYIDLYVTVNGGNEIYYIDNGTNLGLNSTVYTKIRWRYRTSDSTMKAKIVIEFNDATTQTVLDHSDSVTMTVGSETITTGKTIDHIRLHADDSAGHVYYDFVQIYKDDWEIPNFAGGIQFIPNTRDAVMNNPGMGGAITQALGNKLAEVHIISDMTVGAWKRALNPTDVVDGEIFLDNVYEQGDDVPFYWLDDELHQFKVRLDMPLFHFNADGTKLTKTMSLVMREYRKSSAYCSHESYVTRWGLDL